jgi:hypothetical protein
VGANTIIANTYSATASYFTKEYVDELIVFHQRERDAFRSKIYGLESENEHLREELNVQTDALERQCERTRYQ